MKQRIRNQKLNRHNKGNEKKDNDEYNHLRPDDKLISKSSKIKEPSLNKKSQSSISSSTEKKNNNIKTETFLEFFSDFCNNLMYYMPFSLKILLRIVYTQANSIFTISEKDRTYPIFILLFFSSLLFITDYWPTHSTDCVHLSPD